VTAINGDESREQVIAYAAGLGYCVTAAQLVRWHRSGLLPRPSQRSLGRGRGTMTVYPPGAAAQVVALCQIREGERRLDRIAFRLWWEGFAVDQAVIRGQLQVAWQAIEADFQQPTGVATCCGHGIQGVMRRSFGQRRLTAMMTAAQRSPAHGADRLIRGDGPWPPSLDDMADAIGQLVADRIVGARARLAGACG
jgi:hypothetical protein